MKREMGLMRRVVLRGGAAIPLGGLLAACGGGGGAEPSAMLSAGGTAPPPNISNLDASTFMIGVTFDVRGAKRTTLLGTGFAIDERLIATNAHVTQGVLEADKSFSLPPSPQLVQSQATGGQGTGGQGGDPVRGGAGATFRGAVSNPQNPNVQHTIELSVNSNLKISGTSSWPAAPARNLPARTFTLSGRSDTSGRFEIVDDTPERIPGFRRGVYLGLFNSASGAMVGEYYEFNQATNELIYFGDWTASSR